MFANVYTSLPQSNKCSEPTLFFLDKLSPKWPLLDQGKCQLVTTRYPNRAALAAVKTEKISANKLKDPQFTLQPRRN
jgi:hypothetical protein